MIPWSKNTEEAPEKATVTVKFTDKAKDTYVKFTGGSSEQAVCHMKLYYSLVSKMELEDNHETLVKSIKDNIKDLGKLDENYPSQPTSPTVNYPPNLDHLADGLGFITGRIPRRWGRAEALSKATALLY